MPDQQTRRSGASRLPVRLAEIRATLGVAAPLAAANLAQMAMGVTDTVMVGALGAVPLAAVGLGAGFYFISAVVCQGVLTAVAPLAAFSLGAGDRAAALRVGGSGLILAMLLGLPVIGSMMVAARLLDLLGYDHELADQIGRFLHAVAWGAPGFLGFAALRSLLSALLRTRAVMLVIAVCLPANAALNWVFIYGHFGLPRLGLVGSGYASAINQWLMFLGLAAALWGLPRPPGHRLFGGLAGIAADLRRILRLGLPIGGIQALEIGVFTLSAALMGLFGANALAAHQIAINCASITFMVPLGIGQAATVRVAAARGAGAPVAARRAVLVALGLGSGIMVLSALALWTMPRPIVGAYVAIGDPANHQLVTLALEFLAIAAAFQIVDGTQAVAAGALRGYQDTTVPLLLAGIGYWGIGFAGGWVLAFPLGFGPVGLWWGFVLGLATVAVLLTARVLRRARREVAVFLSLS
ncbi:MAG TPA: MATE family efflux transporter [Stellaceae bacterium]|jgi:MATE family multidrug resistance protein|nr:MATE family efflux transporter [Stellaceae bacterium]